MTAPNTPSPPMHESHLGGLKRIHQGTVRDIYDVDDRHMLIVTTDRLVRAWTNSKYVIIADAGHSAMEPGIRAALVRATEGMKTRIS